jgi:hypothetical protein
MEARVESVRFTRGGTTLTVLLPGVGRLEARAAGTSDIPVGALVRLRPEPAAVATLLERA